MTTPTVPTNPGAGPALPVVVVTDAESQGGPAIPVYGWTGQPSDGRSVEGRPAIRVKVIADSDLRINGGNYWIEGRPFAMPVSGDTTIPSVSEGGIAIVVYPINLWPAFAPSFVSAEVGLVNASTVVVTFDENVSASDYATGVTIKVNGVSSSIASATRQVNHAVVYYVMTDAIDSDDIVTWEYAGGNIMGEIGSLPLPTITVKTVTNNLSYAPSLDFAYLQNSMYVPSR